MGKRLLVSGSLVTALAGLIAASPAPAKAAAQVSYPALLTQVRSGPVIRAIINPGRGDVEIKFRDLSEWEAFMPPGAQPALQRLLHRRHIRVLFASRRGVRKPKPKVVHHHLRYIAAGVIGAGAIIGAGAFLYARRRRSLSAPRPSSPSPAPPSP